MTVITYDDLAADFSVETILQKFAGDYNDGINVCEAICDRHAADAGRVALRYERADGRRGEMTFAELQRRSAQFAGFLASRGIGPGDRVAGLLPRTPELLITVLGTLRAGAVYQPLFTAFGAGAIEYRIQQAATKLIVTNPEQWPKLKDVQGVPETLLLAGAGDAFAGEADALFEDALATQADTFKPVRLGPDAPFLQMFTSGTTGKSKGVSVPVKALPAFYVYMRYAVGLRQDDNFWNVADPGWAYGLYYAILGPLLLGCTTHLNEAGFTTDNACEFMRRYAITNLAAAPTVYRLLMSDEQVVANYPTVRLRVASSAGEALNPEVVTWMNRVFGCQVYDHYGQTETGMTSANFHELAHPYREASMGYPLPGYRLVALDANYQEVGVGETGELAVDTANSPLHFFEGYTWGEKSPFHGRYYLTGDVVTNNGEGSFSYAGRDDDIIASAGYRIGPAEVESALLEHDAVVESAVIGKPDTQRGTIVKAYVVTRPGTAADETLVKALQQHVRKRLSTHSFPREIEFVDALPKTSSGKIQRFLLRQQAAKEFQQDANTGALA
ncbi:AMP-binding protein [Marinobacter sp. X15-166B]|uniref:AMP-binding protein n=1 Tax=Marinobacter sp. X15-166B TaxID=1897620 RepID=UPI00085C6BE3|nr:AMP-binding protein [Marinobacter sp. X15-166B]OEY66863.1 AMP-binding protein [Marinobacter sp. X15-166B]